MHTLRIVGAGVKDALQITREGLAQLNTARKILWLGSIQGLQEWAIEQNWLAEDITPLYIDMDVDIHNYNRIQRKVLDDLNQYSDVALLLQGHPRLGVTIVQEFEALRQKQAFNLVVSAGISSFDEMMNDLALDPIEVGTCILDANRLILYDYQMDPCLNYIVYHICSVGNSNTDYSMPSVRNGLFYLKEKLLKHFPSSHSVTLVSSCADINHTSLLYYVTVGELENLSHTISFASSLYIPGLLPKKDRVNREFLRLISGEMRDA